MQAVPAFEDTGTVQDMLVAYRLSFKLRLRTRCCHCFIAWLLYAWLHTL